MSDEEAMMEVQSGNTRMLSVLFERHHRRLYTYLFRTTRDRDLSEDLVQDTFEKIMRKRHTYRREYPFGGWLFRIAKNMLNDHYRNQKLSTVGIEDFDAPQDPRDVERSHIELALMRLKPEFREVLTLTKCQGMRYQEVANIIGISETGVKSRVHRAVKALKDSYVELKMT
ncbi:MAG: RNA polymerase sigma factor [Saprospiraceae bacterium]|nr:RNA polymerase sigma factor [Saprospiraceae bacterium]